MTYQRDPDVDPTVPRRPRDYIRRADGTWSPLAFLLGAVLLALIGWVLLDNRTPGPSTSTTTQTNSDGSTTVPQKKKP
jgi:hypothetical protein